MVRRLIAILLIIAVPLQAAAPPLQKQTAGNSGFSGASAGNCQYPSATTAGNLVLCFVYLQSTTVTITSVTDAGGVTTYHVLGPVIGSNNETFIIWAIVGAGGFGSSVPHFSASATGDSSGAEYSGMAAAGSVFDCNSVGSSGNSTALTSASCTPTASNDVLVAAGGVMQNSSNMTAGGSFTIEANEAHSTQGNSYGWEDENSSSCNSQSASATESVSGQWSFIMAAFKTSSPTSCSAPPQPGLLFLEGGSAVIHGGTTRIK